MRTGHSRDSRCDSGRAFSPECRGCARSRASDAGDRPERRPCAFPDRPRPARYGDRSRARDHTKNLSGFRCPVSFTLAAFCRQWCRSLDEARRPLCVGATARNAPGLSSILPSSAWLLDAGGGSVLALPRRGDRRAHRPLRRAGAGEPRHVCARHVLRKSSSAVAGRCGGVATADRCRSQDGFQVSDDNPLVGLEGRVGLLRRLGDQVTALPEIFSRDDVPRRGWAVRSSCDDD